MGGPSIPPLTPLAASLKRLLDPRRSGSSGSSPTASSGRPQRSPCFASTVRAHRAAVSETTGTAHFFVSDAAHSGWGSLESFADIGHGSEVVETTTLDHFLERERLGRVDFVKIDVEAHEPELLAGAQDSLAHQRLARVMIEFNGPRLAERGHSLEGFLESFSRHGYVPGGLNDPLLEAMTSGRVAAETVCTNLLFQPG